MRIGRPLGIFLILSLGAAAQAEPARRFPTPPDRLLREAAAAPKFAPVEVEDDLSKWTAQMGDQTSRLLRAHDYARLDKLASMLRESKACFENGYWKLGIFYNQAADLRKGASEADWQERIQLLRDWFDNDPDCITPRVAMARALINYAWYARGGGWASTVSRDAWEIVGQRVADARRILEAAKLLPEKCPGWYAAWMHMALLASPDRSEYDSVFNECLKLEPGYTPAYLLKAYYLQPRWHGEQGEWETFAAKSADQIGGENGDMLYAQIVWYIHDLRIFGNPISETSVEWPRVERGFGAIRRRYPDSIFALSEYCAISGFAPTDARNRMRSLFAEVGNRVDLSVWRSIELFKRDYDWAFSR